MAKENLSVIGIWKLLSFESEADDGTVTYPYGKSVAGLVMVDARGYFSAHTMDMKRPSFNIPDPRGGTPVEMKAAFEGYSGYYGTFDIDETKGVIVFHIEGAWLPNWIGSDQVRYYRLNGNHMTVSTATMLFGGKKVIGKLIWERMA